MPRKPAPGRTRANDPEGLRGRLLDVAAEAFQSAGYHATSMHDLMRAAGATGGALHHHFSTKKALGLAVIRERVAKEVAATWIAPVASARSAASGVAVVLKDIIAGLEARGRVQGCPLNNLALELSLSDPDFREALRGVFDQWRVALADRIRIDKTAGRLAGGDASELAGFIVAAYSGAMAMAKADQNAAALKACAKQIARIMRG
jgi:AcrR family transcriptional regulator